MDIKTVDLPAQRYIYVDCECPIDGPAIAEAMGQGFAAVFGFLGENGIAPQSSPMAVYPVMPSNGRMQFRCGAAVGVDDAAKADGPVKAADLPAGPALHATHVGAYMNMNQTHDALWTHAKSEGIAATMPVWEVYVDDPGDTPEATLRTEIYHAIG